VNTLTVMPDMTNTRVMPCGFETWCLETEILQLRGGEVTKYYVR